jgi:hypothetical protein
MLSQSHTEYISSENKISYAQETAEPHVHSSTIHNKK